MNFWILRAPEYESDYRHSYVNGALTYPFRLPGVKCDVCGNTFGGRRVVPFECPVSLRNNAALKSGAWPIPRAEHFSLQRHVLNELGLNGDPFVALRPGDTFQPCYLDIPSRPRADFLWPDGKVLVVSERIKEFFLTECPNQVTVLPISLRKIGRREAKERARVPTTGEPEDIINEEAPLTNHSGVGPYYQLMPVNCSAYPREWQQTAACPGCGKVELQSDDSALYMRDEMWTGSGIFFLATTRRVVITDQVKHALLSYRPSNLRPEASVIPQTRLSNPFGPLPILPTRNH